MKPTRKIEFSSPSLSFRKSVVEVEVLEVNPKLKPRVTWSVAGETFYSTDCCKNFEQISFYAKRTAVYSKNENFRLASPEHLAPVFLMWPSRRINVNLPDPLAPELPLLDGSAFKYFSSLRRVAGTPESLCFYDSPLHEEWPLCEGGKKYGFVRIAPSETFEVEYLLERPEFDFCSSAFASIYSAEDLYNILESRTFIFDSELEAARKNGWLSGIEDSCGLLLSKGGKVSNDDEFRIAHEPARHKILDLIGDLTFVWPALPRVRIEILNGGHASHHQILKKVLPYVIRFSSKV